MSNMAWRLQLSSFWGVSFCIFLISAFIRHCACQQSLIAQFDVNPGGEVHTIEKELEIFRCKFTYSAQGGTNEQWSMKLKTDGSKTRFQCTVDRHGGTSYLFFQQVKLEVIGAHITEIEAFGNEEKPLNPNEFTINEAKTEVSEKSGKFNSQLAALVLHSTTKPLEDQAKSGDRVEL